MAFLAPVDALPSPESMKFPVFGRKWDQESKTRGRRGGFPELFTSGGLPNRV
jgi:hypothetical protein